MIRVLWEKEGYKKNNYYWSTKDYLLLMFLGYGTQQHCFALLVAYSTEFWKLAMTHLNFSICLAKQLISFQHLSLKAFVYLLQNIKREFFSPHFSVHNLFNNRQRILPGLQISATLFAQALPKTTMSRSEFAPSRLAPWTEAQAVSPAAINPGTTASGSSPLIVITWIREKTY